MISSHDEAAKRSRQGPMAAETGAIRPAATEASITSQMVQRLTVGSGHPEVHSDTRPSINVLILVHQSSHSSTAWTDPRSTTRLFEASGDKSRVRHAEDIPGKRTTAETNTERQFRMAAAG